MRLVMQTIFALLGTVGFAVLFHVKGFKIVASAIGGALSWVVYLIMMEFYQDKVIAILFATITAAILSEILARVMRAPVIILLVPMLIPLIPGSDLYYATYNLVQNDTVNFTINLRLVIEEAGAIAFGIILVTCVVQVILKIWNHYRRETKL